MHILLVEDDELLGDGIRMGLQQDGYVVDWVKNGSDADGLLTDSTFDVAILDVNLPGKSGFSVLADARNRGVQLPILILTAKDSIDDRIKGLDLGTDDYLTKPFDFNEITARLRALLRRSSGRAAPVIQHDNITLDPAAHTVALDGRSVKIARREYALLHALLENAGKVVSRNKLVDVLYGLEEEIDSNTLEVHIHYLRKKFGNDFIRTIRGVGYMVKKSIA